MGKASRRKKSVRPVPSLPRGETELVADPAVTAMTPRADGRHGGRISIFSGHARWVSLALIAACLTIYAPVRQFPFVNTDDAVYITENANVLQGLSLANIGWALTEARVPYWHPLTFMSHMLDVELFGTTAGGHHVTSVILHIVTALLLFGLMLEMTGGLWRSAVVAGLFAIHPLRVESVAWVAERKDVLSTGLWIATTWAYVRYVRRSGAGRYVAFIALFALGLMAKPMIVTLPFALLLLDYWPLRRLSLDGTGTRKDHVPLLGLVKEKAPLFALALLASLITFVAQRNIGATESLTALPLSLRLANGLVSYVAYIGDLFWPTRLVALYPYPHSVAVPLVIAAVAILAVITVGAIVVRRTRPYLLVGWLWYLGTLLPVIGLIQVGPQARADRFTYIPHIGLLIMIVWGLADLLTRWPKRRVVLAPVATAALVACAVIASRQVQYWRSSEALWQRTLSVTRDNGVAHYNYGVWLSSEGREDEALRHLRDAVRLEPDFATAHNRLALALDRRADYAGATAELAEVVRLMPQSAPAYANLGVSLAKEGKTAEAIEAFSQALLIDPNDATSRSRLAYLRRGGTLKGTVP